MTSRCVGCQETFVLSGNFLILERAKNRSRLSQFSKMDGPLL
jgi:hypothetical protein